MAESETGMEVADMKRLLSKSKTEPVNVAIGQNGKNAVMMLNKQKAPKAVSKMLEDQFDDVKNLRWGTAFVDIDENPKLVILTLNRAVSGMASKLKKTLKGTGFSKVRIQDESGAVCEADEQEEHEGEEQQAGGPQAANGQQQGTPELPTQQPPTDQPPSQQAGPEGPVQQAPEQAPQQPQPTNLQPLVDQVTGLIKKVMAAIPGAKEGANELKQVVTAAATAVKAGTENAIREAIQTLETALAKLGGNGQGAPNGADQQQANGGDQQQANGADQQQAMKNANVVLQKSRLAWVATRKKLEGDIQKLHDAMAKHYDGHGFGNDLDKVFNDKVEPILNSLDHSLAEKLDAVSSSTDPGQRQKLVGEVKQLIDQYESFVSSNKVIGQLESNPFVPIAIVKTTTTTLNLLKGQVSKMT